MQLKGHIEDFHASLSCDSTGNARTALGRLLMDGIAQIMSFMPPQSITRSIHTLSAVCPQMRLDAETLRIYRYVDESYGAVVVSDNQLVYGITEMRNRQAPPTFAQSLWWADWCGLPLSVVVANARSDVLALLTESDRDRVEELIVYVFSEVVCAQDSASECDGRCSTVLCALSTFPRLTKLRISGFRCTYGSRATDDLSRVLRVAAKMPISEIRISFFINLSDLSALAGSQHLQRLTVTYCGIRSVKDLVSCSMLEELDISENRQLQSVSELADAPRLKTLVARHCDIKNLNGLGNFPHLINLDVSRNVFLNNLRGLAGAPWLRVMKANYCTLLRCIDGLGSCHELTDLEIRENLALKELGGLAGAWSLRRIDALHCNLRSVEGLDRCPRLATIELNADIKLKGIPGLAGCIRLKC
ncbi:hypothetical protein ABB37_06285 [Leptomonas pyrrhocoris]|uniref:Leucine-rich repeat protein (LRRP) n=1 Tax=Leptomonas pyrrhocoris TaxID=157538 RepID=A0A0M9FYH1_LEPPY|nr:hypothetical protein ABB37_06285 [Leptomonas pyrrhocoris]KPA78685.1 hypothetical protein ABB37_06285 [Leptomonas pyrrhocoris]|eukprot:XP_015657124.1 hypothetical protein ABB37_06285 [Leptomonas pyrrhocoris]